MDTCVIGTEMMGRNHVRVYTDLKEGEAMTGVEIHNSMDILLQKAEYVSAGMLSPYHFRTASRAISANPRIPLGHVEPA